MIIGKYGIEFLTVYIRGATTAATVYPYIPDGHGELAKNCVN